MNRKPDYIASSKPALIIGLTLLALIAAIVVGGCAKLVCEAAEWNVSFLMLAVISWVAFEILLIGSYLWAGVDWDH